MSRQVAEVIARLSSEASQAGSEEIVTEKTVISSEDARQLPPRYDSS